MDSSSFKHILQHLAVSPNVIDLNIITKLINIKELTFVSKLVVMLRVFRGNYLKNS